MLYDKINKEQNLSLEIAPFTQKIILNSTFILFSYFYLFPKEFHLNSWNSCKSTLSGLFCLPYTEDLEPETFLRGLI